MADIDLLYMIIWPKCLKWDCT